MRFVVKSFETGADVKFEIPDAGLCRSGARDERGRGRRVRVAEGALRNVGRPIWLRLPL